MSKVLIRNEIAKGHTKSFYLPCNKTEAKTFCDVALDGAYSVLEAKTPFGSDTKEAYKVVTLMIADKAGKKMYLNLAVKPTTTEAELYTAFEGKTVNTIVVKKLAILRDKLIGTISKASDSSN